MKTIEFKDILRELRKERGLTQQQLAEQLKLSLSIISKWENGKHQPSIEDLKLLVNFFNVSADYLIGLED